MMQEINDGDRCYITILPKFIRFKSVVFLKHDAVSIQWLFSL